MQFSQNKTNVTLNKSITFPIAYKSWNTLIGVGFVIDGISAQSVSLRLTGFTTGSEVRKATTYSWLYLGT